MGEAGNDTLDGGQGDDTMEGGAGNDFFQVDASGDRIIEAAGAAGGIDTAFIDLFEFNAGASAVNVEKFILRDGGVDFQGNAQANTIAGGAGADTIAGGGGNDLASGGGGNDFFVLDHASAGNVMKIADFLQGTDRLVLDNAAFDTFLAGDGLAEGVHLINGNTVAGTQPAGAGPTLLYVASTGALYYDSNGTAAGGSVLIATLGDATHAQPYALHASDFTGLA